MNPVVARLTAAGLLGRRRVVVLALLPLVLLVIAVLFRLVDGTTDSSKLALLNGLGLGLIVPLVCVIVGTGSIGPEIEDGSVVYLLSKPLRRSVIITTKLAVAVATAWLLAAVPVVIAGYVLGAPSWPVLGYGLAAAVACVTYCALFLLLAVLSRNAVVIGLLYALIWETTIAAFVPGARSLSVRQWSISLAETIGNRDGGFGITADVGLTTAVVLLIVVTAAATAYATSRLRSLTLSQSE